MLAFHTIISQEFELNMSVAEFQTCYLNFNWASKDFKNFMNTKALTEQEGPNDCWDAPFFDCRI